MRRGLVIKQIARRTGVIGIPRTTTTTGRVLIEPGESIGRAVNRVLVEIKEKTKRDGKDRQIELVKIQKLKSGRHRTTSEVLFRVYRSHSDGKVYVYSGPAHQGSREDK